MKQPVLTVCGDSTFYHAVIPALINAVHHRANMILIVLDNGGTAMTGFQPHPGLTVNAMGEEAPAVDIARICEAIGVKVEIRDPFNLEETRKAINCFLEEEGGVRVLILRQICGLSPEKKAVKRYEVRIDEALCLGENCGCNRLCTRIFRCPGINWDGQKKKARIDEVICAGCGVCSSICPAGAIKRGGGGIRSEETAVVEGSLQYCDYRRRRSGKCHGIEIAGQYAGAKGLPGYHRRNIRGVSAGRLRDESSQGFGRISMESPDPKGEGGYHCRP